MNPKTKNRSVRAKSRPRKPEAKLFVEKKPVDRLPKEKLSCLGNEELVEHARRYALSWAYRKAWDKDSKKKTKNSVKQTAFENGRIPYFKEEDKKTK